MMETFFNHLVHHDLQYQYSKFTSTFLSYDLWSNLLNLVKILPKTLKEHNKNG